MIYDRLCNLNDVHKENKKGAVKYTIKYLTNDIFEVSSHKYNKYFISNLRPLFELLKTNCYMSNISVLKRSKKVISKYIITVCELKDMIKFFTDLDKEIFISKFVDNLDSYYSKLVLCKKDISVLRRTDGYIVLTYENVLEIISDSYLAITPSSDLGFFRSLLRLKVCYIDNWDITRLVSLSAMFDECVSLRKVILKNFDTKNIDTMREMFYGCESLEYLNLSEFNTTSCFDMNSMFAKCRNLKELDISNFNFDNLKQGMYMFSYCSLLENIHIGSFTRLSKDIKPGNFHNIFYETDSLNPIYKQSILGDYYDRLI